MSPPETRSRRPEAVRPDTGRSADRSVSVAPPIRIGPQAMVRCIDGAPVSGRPPDSERDAIAAGLGKRLRGLRKEHKLGLRDLERRSGVNRSTISRLERGLRRPRPSVLGWLAWGFDPDRVQVLKDELCAAAGPSLILESRWSERMHARRAYRSLLDGGLLLPAWLTAPHAVAIFSGMPLDEEDMARARQAQTAAREGRFPWPGGASGSIEAFYLRDEMMSAPLRELQQVGRAQLAEIQARTARDKHRRQRELRAQLGLTGVTKPRPPWIPWQPPAARSRRTGGGR